MSLLKHPELPSHFKKITAIVYLILAAGLIALSTTWYLWPEQPIDQQAYKEQVFASCHNAARDHRFRVVDRPESGYLLVHRNGLSDWRSRLYQTQLIIEQCSDAFEMTYFCMGPECQDMNERRVRGIAMTLMYQDPATREAQ